MIRKVPKEFVLGAAMSAYQMEGAAAAGGREPSVWEDWLRRTVPAAHRHTSDFYHHYEEDIAACAAKGIRALSLSFSWSRIMRRDGTVNPEGLAFYDRVIDACLRHGVEPFVALYHFDLPADLAPVGWLAPQTVEAYLRYARVCFRHFGARVRHWLTLKDPVTEVTQGYLTGLFPPGQKLALGRAVLALHKMLTAHAQAVLLYKSMELGGSIGIAHRAEGVYPLTQRAEDVLAARRDDVLTNGILLDAVLMGRYQEATRQLLAEVLREDETFVPPEEELEVLAQAAHGLYKGRPKLDFERLKEIRSRVSVPLVLHGASDVPDELVEKAISLGITKVNIATDLKIPFANAVKAFFKEHPEANDPRKYMTPGKQAMKEVVIHKIKVCGSEGRA